jgi:hypothetical protein
MTVTATNVLALPLAEASIFTGNNEDWLEAFEYLAGGDGSDPSPGDPLDLRGINFQLMVRRAPDDPEVVLWASTDDGTIQVGAPPDSNVLIINVPLATMTTRNAGLYVADMIARDADFQRRIMTIDLEVVEGITR